MINNTNFLLENNKKSSILILRLSSIGDIVLTTHLLRNLRLNFPDVIIDFLTFDNFKEILEFNQRINSLFYIKKQDLKNGKIIVGSNSSVNFDVNSYDLIIDLQNNKYSHKLLAGVNLKTVQVNKQRHHKLSLVYLKKPIIKNFSIPLNYFSTIDFLKINDDALGLEFWLPDEKDYTPFRRNNQIKKLNVISIAPGAAHATKQLPIETLISVIQELQIRYACQINIIGGKNEIPLGKTITQKIKSGIQDYCGKLSLIQTAQKIDASDIILTNDTGLMHIAAARQVPVVAFFGSSVKEFGFEPFRAPHKILEKEIWCRPCSHIGRSFCPLLHFKCMRNITKNEILDAIENFIS